MDNMLPEYKYIASLVAKEKLMDLSEQECKDLEEWKAKSEENSVLYHYLKQKSFVGDIHNYEQIDVDEGWKRLKKLQVKKRILKIRSWSAAAAVVFVAIVGSMFVLMNEKSSLNGSLVSDCSIVPGSPKAELILADGSVHYLNNENKKEELNIDGSFIYNDGSELNYKSDTESATISTQMVYNTLNIPIGGEYQIVLSDGTKVWLNSQTSLKYPVAFMGENREVELTGEAYFFVAHNAEKPFVVQLKDDVKIQVLGTSFNVRSYADEKNIETVLEQGKVRVECGDKGMTIKPGMMATYSSVNSSFSAEKVNCELYTSWRLGHFVFQEEKLESILDRLSRWYKFQVVYNDEGAKKMLYSGSLRKYDTIDKFLEALELSGGVHFNVKGESIIVYLNKE